MGILGVSSVLTLVEKRRGGGGEERGGRREECASITRGRAKNGSHRPGFGSEEPRSLLSGESWGVRWQEGRGGQANDLIIRLGEGSICTSKRGGGNHSSAELGRRKPHVLERKKGIAHQVKGKF